jgi:hypothetical protein
MADKNQLKIADQVDLAEDDPFAELTRIMGFDPRQPAKQARAQEQAPAPVDLVAEEDDFSLDLEKELLGGFDLEDEVAEENPPVETAAPAAEVSAYASEPDAAESEAPEDDFDFSADFDAAMAASGETEPQAEPEALGEPEAEFDLGLDLTDGDLLALDLEAAQPGEPAATESETTESGAVELEGDFDLGLTDDDLRALDPEAAQPVEAAAIESGVVEPEADFDLDLTENDVRTPDFEASDLEAPELEASQPYAPAPEVEAFAGDKDIDADLVAAMADIDMDFLGEAPAPEPVAATPASETWATESRAVESTDDDAAETAAEDELHLFDEDDFRLDDEPVAEPMSVAEPMVDPEPEPQPELDESAFSFGEDGLHLDEALAADEPAQSDREPEDELEVQPVDEFPFDEVDFAADDLQASDTEAAADPEPVAAEPALAEEVEPVSAIPLPPFMPRKLPTSPMDVAAEEFRQREVAAAPAEAEFNLEDELNALLGNIRSNQAAVAAASEPAPAYDPPAPAYEPPASEADSPAAYEPESPHEEERTEERPEERPEEIVSFDAPEHPANIEDDLSWELDDIFAAEGAPEPAEPDLSEEDQFAEEQIEEDQPQAYAEDGQYGAYAEAAQPEDAYAEEEPAPIEFDDDDFDLSPEDIQPEPPAYYGNALAGAAIGAAASRFDSGFASRSFESPSARQPEHYAAAPGEPGSFSPHRDPVVRGNPLKEDPLDVITALAAKYSKKEPEPVDQSSGDEAVEDEDIDISAAFEEQPDVETVEVADRAVALADDLDIPELAEEEELPAVSAYDDLDAEFSSLLSDMNAEPRAAQPASGGFDDTLGGGFNARPYQSQMAASPTASYQASQPARKAYDDDPEPDSLALDDDLPGSSMPSDAQFADDGYDYDPDFDQEIAEPQHLAAESRQPKSRGMLLAALVGGVALVGAVGAFALSFGDGSGDTPAIVAADDGPVKVKPENPGGTTVPNQDNKVYETVAGEGAAGAPQQEKLVTTAEEPVDVTPPPPAVEEETAAAPSGKSEDRIEQILQEAETQTDAEIVAVAPRKVRTMVVKPDGTLVPREDEPGAAASPAEPAETVAAAVPEAAAPIVTPETTPEAVPESTPESTGALPAAPQGAAPPAAPAPEETAATAPQPEEVDAAAAPASEDRGAMPETAPIAPLRPADQPVDVVGEVKPDRVAAATAAAAGGNWAMQIASQPSEAAAQSSYQDLVRRYGGVLQDRDVNIVKAEIAGKGTFWRVRVPANSRNEAISLCESYKAAGGNCFVSR